jgi:hypothetical protein
MSAFIVSKECMDRAVAGLVSRQIRGLARVDVHRATGRQLGSSLRSGSSSVVRNARRDGSQRR